MKRKTRILNACAIGTLSCIALLLFSPTAGLGESLYGVIACSRGCEAWGSSNNCNSMDEAVAKAIAECEKSGKKCKKLRHVIDACHALATGSNGAYGHDWANEKDEAERKAIEQCKKYGGKGCAVQCSTCTDW